MTANKAVTHGNRPEPTPAQHVGTMFQRPDRITEPLDVILTVFNNARWRSRWKLYEDFVRHAESAGDAVRIWTVEVVFGAREAAVTDPANPRHLRLHTSTELWHKERSQALLVQKVIAQHPSAQYFAFIDADVTFARADWADETRHALQHYDVVQMWHDAYDLDSQGNVLQHHRGFGACYCEGAPMLGESASGYYHGEATPRSVAYWHPGFAWAWRRSAYEAVGGLIDHAILGSADFHMAYALIGRLDLTLKRQLTKEYAEPMREWQRRAEYAIKHNVGFVQGSIFHHWHGPKAARRYKDRWKILEETRFNPRVDLAVDANGLYRFAHFGHERSTKMRDLCRDYFSQRNEDQV